MDVPNFALHLGKHEDSLFSINTNNNKVFLKCDHTENPIEHFKTPYIFIVTVMSNVALQGNEGRIKILIIVRHWMRLSIYVQGRFQISLYGVKRH